MKQTNSQQLIGAAIEMANRMNVAVNIAIVDGGVNMMAFQRMNHAPLGSIDVALKKARSAVLFGVPTEVLGQLAREQQLESIEQTNDGIILFAGGEPVRRDDTLLGGIGISGGSAAQDKEIALYAIKQLQSINNEETR